MKTCFGVLSAIALAIFLSCNNGKVKPAMPESEAKDTVKTKMVDEKLAFLQKFYNDFFIDEKDWDGLTDYYKQHCSEGIVKAVREAYEYECPDGDCYGWWIFRDDAQDVAEGGYQMQYSYIDDDWFNVRIKNFDVVNVRVRIEIINDTLMITGLKHPEYGEIE